MRFQPRSTSRKWAQVVIAPLAALIAVAIAAPARADIPNGNGLIVETAPCASGEITVLLTRSAKAASVWNLTTDEHTVAKSFTAVFTFTPTEGGAPTVNTESKDYGVKQRLRPENICKVSFGFPVRDGFVAVEITTISVAVPPEQ